MHEKTLTAGEPTLKFLRAVIDRYNDLIHLHARVRGTKLMIPPEQRVNYDRVGRMIRRFGESNYTTNESEVKSLKAFAQWTLDINAEIRNQPKQDLEVLK